uniref:Partial AB-hydrolase lipase domain-containing protein n=1 Tax=Timema poppense TaxID=170557 RepID=A0A7R9DG75_TIMPO|nr:unnamed protein product [Timema poppensis]
MPLFMLCSTAMHKDRPQLIVKYGYYVEIHHVVTEDGFILELHRIPGSPRNPPAQGKSVFLLEHGLLCSSADWLLQGPGKSLVNDTEEGASNAVDCMAINSHTNK